MIWGLMVSPLFQKWLISINLGQGFSQKVGFILMFGPILRAGFCVKILAFSNKKSNFVLVSGLLDFVFSLILFNYFLKGRFLTKEAP